MAQSKYYSPRLQHTLISPLYHAAKSKGIPMTALASSLVAEGLRRMSLTPSDACVADLPHCVETSYWRAHVMIASPDQESVAKVGRTKDELLETISASRLGTWLSCRLKFYFRYLSGKPKKHSSAMRVGTVVHAVLQHWNLARWRKAPLLEEMVMTVFDQAGANAEEDEPIDWGG